MLIEKDNDYILIIDRVESIMRLVQKENFQDLIIAFNKVESELSNIDKYLFYFDIEDSRGHQHEEKVLINRGILEYDLNHLYNILYKTFQKYN